MRVKNEITHMRIIDCTLGGRFPSFMSRFEIWVGADIIDGGQVFEFSPVRIDKLSANDEVEELLGSFALGGFTV